MASSLKSNMRRRFWAMKSTPAPVWAAASGVVFGYGEAHGAKCAGRWARRASRRRGHCPARAAFHPRARTVAWVHSAARRRGTPRSGRGSLNLVRPGDAVQPIVLRGKRKPSGWRNWPRASEERDIGPGTPAASAALVSAQAWATWLRLHAGFIRSLRGGSSALARPPDILPDVSQRACSSGVWRGSRAGRRGLGRGGTGAAGAQQAVVYGQFGVGEGGGDPVDAVVVGREHGDRALWIPGQPLQVSRRRPPPPPARGRAAIEDDGRVAGLGVGLRVAGRAG